MKIRRFQPALRFQKPIGLAIGNFDGVHQGHQAVLDRLLRVCSEHHWHPVVMGFYPHPRAVVEGSSPPWLSNMHDRAYWLAHYGVAEWILVAFTRAFMQVTARAFITHYLTPLAIRHILVGDDFHFGYHAQGDFQYLQKHGKQAGFTVESITRVTDNHATRISSSLIRRKLEMHALEEVTTLLGHPLTLTARVQHGKALGRQLLTKTANLHIPDNWALPDGVYVVQLRICGVTGWHWGVANVGGAPTFSVTQRKLEVHVFAELEDFYGKMVQVAIHKFLRRVEKFPDTFTLQQQIQRDITAARLYINAQENKGN